MKEQDIFIRNLKNLMNKYKLNQAELADKLDVTKPSISLVLSGKQFVSTKMLLKICDVFGVTIQQMFTPDPRQFPVKQDIEDSNKDAIIEFQQSQIEQSENENSQLKAERVQLEEDNLRLEEEIEKLRKEISRYDFMQDDVNVTVEADKVSHPTHYNIHKHECIDEMIAVFGYGAVKTFCKLNVWKYRYRTSAKGGEEDLRKADEYMDILLGLGNRGE